MNTEMTSPTANLAGRWGLDEGTGSAIADSSGNGVNGTTVASPTWVDGFNVVAPPSGAGAPAVRRFERLRHRRHHVSASADTSSRSKPGSSGPGGGVTTSSGSGGVTDVIPLDREGPLGRGRQQRQQRELPLRDQPGRPTRWRPTSRKTTVARARSGANHPVTSSTVVTPNVWHHAAATYNGSAWFLYLDGSPGGHAPAQSGPPASAASIVTTIGTSMNTTPALHVRVRSPARSTRSASGTSLAARPQIQAAMNTEIAGATSGLAGPVRDERDGWDERPDTSGSSDRRDGRRRPDMGEPGCSVRGAGQRARRAGRFGAGRRCHRPVGGAHPGRDRHRSRHQPDERDVLRSSGRPA